METGQMRELLLQSLEQERGGLKVYRSAIKCALRDDLRDEWSQYLAQTEVHVQVLTELCSQLSIDPGMQTPGCMILRELGAALGADSEKGDDAPIRSPG